ncbi:MAG: alpha/beta hydrolase [Candidatus Eremiobacteraeota bacterium]|nr:alpha/beta hydrolase [Candidatus Eremiobacteraeota bacterium]MBC5822444.1 alpha/beta hydrolase [Candidatus Eremiobacteraeota bacterium]
MAPKATPIRRLAPVFFIILSLVGRASSAAREPQYLHVQMRSSVLSQFWGQPVSIDAHVLLPDSYYKDPQKHYPVFYWIQGFGGEGQINLSDELRWQRAMRRLHAEFIVVFLNGMFNDEHQEFADSANNGPWGTALTTEFIPETEKRFRAIGTPETRFVGGHSSGGWSALWLQISYPDRFGGEWSLAPDPVDFRDFTGPDLTRMPPQNFFKDDAGREYAVDGEPLRRFVTGPGWKQRQFESFDAVFSPRGAEGKPEPLFNRRTGLIDPTVARYWEQHYDIAALIREDWSTLGPQLRHKIHIIVGTRDQFHLDGPVALLKEELHALGSDAEIDFAEGANHFTVFDWKGDAIYYILNEAVAPTAPASP